MFLITNTLQLHRGSRWPNQVKTRTIKQPALYWLLIAHLLPKLCLPNASPNSHFLKFPSPSARSGQYSEIFLAYCSCCRVLCDKSWKIWRRISTKFLTSKARETETNFINRKEYRCSKMSTFHYYDDSWFLRVRTCFQLPHWHDVV